MNNIAESKKTRRPLGGTVKIIKHLFAGTAVKIRTYANFKIIAAQLYPNFTSRSTFVRLRAQFEHSASSFGFRLLFAKKFAFGSLFCDKRARNGREGCLNILHRFLLLA